MRRRLGFTLIALSLALVFLSPRSHADSYTFSLIPASGNVVLPASGAAEGWGYSISSDIAASSLATATRVRIPFSTLLQIRSSTFQTWHRTPRQQKTDYLNSPGTSLRRSSPSTRATLRSAPTGGPVVPCRAEGSPWILPMSWPATRQQKARGDPWRPCSWLAR